MTIDTLATLAAAETTYPAQTITLRPLIRRELAAHLADNPADKALLELRYDLCLGVEFAAHHWGCTETYIQRRWEALYEHLSSRVGVTLTPPDLTSYSPYSVFSRVAKEWDKGVRELHAKVSEFAVTR